VANKKRVCTAKRKQANKQTQETKHGDTQPSALALRFLFLLSFFLRSSLLFSSLSSHLSTSREKDNTRKPTHVTKHYQLIIHNNSKGRYTDALVSFLFSFLPCLLPYTFLLFHSFHFTCSDAVVASPHRTSHVWTRDLLPNCLSPIWTALRSACPNPSPQQCHGNHAEETHRSARIPSPISTAHPSVCPKPFTTTMPCESC